MRDQVLIGLDCAKCKIDNIIVFSSTMEKHGHHLPDMFEHLGAHGLKWHLGASMYLGHMIYLGGLGVQKVKVDAISKVQKLTNVSQLGAFLRLTNYYKRFVKGLNQIAKPLI